MITIYECTKCRKLFKHAENALDCCKVDAKEIQVETLYHTDGSPLYVFVDDPNQKPLPPIV